jgi:site-specific DNA-methyltransferase (adenine-specific)
MEVMKTLPDQSVDLILCDLPYELDNWTNPLQWDKMLPLPLMMEQYWRLIKKNHAIVLFCNEPNATHLRMSAINLFKYNIIWIKTKVGGVMNAKVKPLKIHETILVFSEGTTSPGRLGNMPYYPQGLTVLNKVVKNTKNDRSVFSDRPSIKESYTQEFTNYPTDVISFASVQKGKHPTQKPVDLMEYLIKTYTKENDVVLDNCMGSGTTGVACINTKRNFIGIEQDQEYFDIAKTRIETCDLQSDIFITGEI